MDLLEDEAGKQFWINNFDSELSVAFSTQFFPALFNYFRRYYPDHIPNEIPHICLPLIIKYCFGESRNNCEVTIERFAIFLCRFGPFHVCLSKASRCFYTNDGIADWFYGSISRAEAEALLSGGTDGSFLVRFSETQPKNFTLTYLKVHKHGQREEFKNCLIVNVGEEGYSLTEMSSRKDDDKNSTTEKVFSSISEFIRRSSGRLKSCKPSPISLQFHNDLKKLSGFKTVEPFTLINKRSSSYSDSSSTMADRIDGPSASSMNYSMIDGNDIQIESTSDLLSNNYPNSFQRYNSEPHTVENTSQLFQSYDPRIRNVQLMKVPTKSPSHTRSISAPSITNYSEFNRESVDTKNSMDDKSNSTTPVYGTFLDLRNLHLSCKHSTNNNTSPNTLGNCPPPIPNYMAKSPIVNNDDWISHEQHVEEKDAAEEELNRGIVYYNKKSYNVAIAHLLEADRLAKLHGKRLIEARSLGNLGTVYMDKNNPKRAIEYYIASLEISKAIGDERRELATLNNLVLACMQETNSELALQFCYRSLELAKTDRNRQLILSRIEKIKTW